MNNTIETKDAMVRIFARQKFEAFGVSLFSLIWWFSLCKTEDGTDLSLLFTFDAIPYIAVFLLALSSWYLNLQAETACGFETCYAKHYAGHAALQDFILFACLCTIVLKGLYPILDTMWKIVGWVGLCLIIILKFRSLKRVMFCIGYAERNNVFGPSEQKPNITLKYFFCIAIRYAAVGYCVYYIFFS